MLSLNTSMSSNFLMFSLFLFGFSIFEVFCQNPISNIQVLDNYLNGASKFVHNRNIFDGLTLVMPKSPIPVHHSLRRPHHLSNQPQHSLLRPQNQPILHPLQLSQPLIPSPLQPILLSPLERPDLEPVFRPVIVPNFDKHRKPKKNVYKPMFSPKYSQSKKYYHNHRRDPSKYPKSINDRLREKDYEEEIENDQVHDHRDDHRHDHRDEHRHDHRDDERDDQKHDHRHDYRDDDRDDHRHDHKHSCENEDEQDPLENSEEEELKKPKSYYSNLPPYRKQKSESLEPVFKVRPQLSMNRTIDYNIDERPLSYSKSYAKSHSEPKYSERLRKPKPQSDWPHKSSTNSSPNDHDNAIAKSHSLFDNSPPFSTPNQLNFIKPKIQTKDKKFSDSPEMLSTDYREERPKKQRTATANQVFVREKDKHSHNDHLKKENDDHDHKHDDHAKATQQLPKEDLESNDDPKFYPHQYAIEIRWKDKNNIHYHLDAPKGDVGDREMHSSKELDHARHRKYKHEEEEHWHEKKWLKEGLRKAYLNGKNLPVRIVQPKLNLPNPDFGPLPLYAQPLPNGATLDQINQHFAIPTPNFRVNNRFMEWAKNAIPLNQIQSMNNYLTLYG